MQFWELVQLELEEGLCPELVEGLNLICSIPSQLPETASTYSGSTIKTTIRPRVRVNIKVSARDPRKRNRRIKSSVSTPEPRFLTVTGPTSLDLKAALNRFRLNGITISTRNARAKTVSAKSLEVRKAIVGSI
jgi:hypothetical protein